MLYWKDKPTPLLTKRSHEFSHSVGCGIPDNIKGANQIVSIVSQMICQNYPIACCHSIDSSFRNGDVILCVWYLHYISSLPYNNDKDMRLQVKTQYHFISPYSATDPYYQSQSLSPQAKLPLQIGLPCDYNLELGSLRSS